MAQSKIVIISDVHLSDGQSYSWFKDDSTLKGFLNQTAHDPQVKELVLLGDVFDVWLYPIQVAPWDAKKIIQKWSGIITALQSCAAKLPKVYYINGNHDMGVTQADLSLISPNIEVISATQYNAQHPNTLHLEHGHLVDMFNAPDISGDPIQGLPFGYFVTRLVATAGNHDEIWNALSDIVKSHFGKISSYNSFVQQMNGSSMWRGFFEGFIEALLEDFIRKAGKLLIEALVDLLVEYVKLADSSVNDNSNILLPNGAKVNIGEVKKHYHKLLLNWFKKYGLADLYNTATASTGLDWYAEKLLSQSTAKTVVMGHTHHGQCLSIANGQYVNSGCWCAKAQPTYVEVTLQAAPTVVLKSYPENAVIPCLMPMHSLEMAAPVMEREETMPQMEQKCSDQPQ
ncbi:MAG: Calcineurin-like phosphoesterase [Candidatus Electronema aureum]|uniref:Calcineurin-like phosphoesterase n=1 Tax=Candidatus Electronema aureum TaxID=2005002 RepID=A0A521G1P5_9BACT|nr:MAG: Calcineurin-like phosphoesterase [Candidatus Electronema aureum]